MDELILKNLRVMRFLQEKTGINPLLQNQITTINERTDQSMNENDYNNLYSNNNNCSSDLDGITNQMILT